MFVCLVYSMIKSMGSNDVWTLMFFQISNISMFQWLSFTMFWYFYTTHSDSFITVKSLLQCIFKHIVLLTQHSGSYRLNSLIIATESFNHYKTYRNHFTFILSLCQSILNYCTVFLSIVFVLKKWCQSCMAKSFITCQKERGQIIASRCEAFSLIAAFISCLCFFRQPITPQRELLLKYTVIL